ncbi:C40 family peptidase [Muriicola sp. Z0-33]|uniref:C40 family peptidase n=1 Tax=Muriicola sp. Z0-33 TaxID=2816957 RepID=UPI002237D55F|nr:C40 family peptidase [Muriicola sp. Z0-33]MCW5517417.1 C40 family peptidase [Muriicola sp. Z0-33]
MHYGICKLSIVPVRDLADDASEMTTQLLYGDHFKILEQRKKWSKIRVAYDKCEGWICNKQALTIPEEAYKKIEASKKSKFTTDLVGYISCENGVLLPIVIGSSILEPPLLPHTFEGNFNEKITSKSELINTALLYLNAPYLWGGKTPFGIDCSGFTQMVYKINGFFLKRNASEQATQGEALSFIEESEAGDLAFFDNSDGEIDHVGIIMKNNYIIHAHGKVRIDRLDHTGIFNTEEKNYTHKLRVIKKII